MRTKIRFRADLGTGLAILLVLVVISAIGVGLTRQTAGASPEATSLPADDQARLDNFIFTAPGPAAIDADRALAAVRVQYNLSAPGVHADAYLQAVAAREPGEAAIIGGGRTMWIVAITGMETYPELPAGFPGSTAIPRVLAHAYAFVDATSGEFLFTSWKE